ncbi:MAG: SURF1 family protein [Gemmatimonadota bacterium]
MASPRRPWLLVALAVVVAGVFVRLGIWQLDRRTERRAANAAHRERLAAPPLAGPDLLALPADSSVWRRAELTGTYDYGRELVVRARSLRGAPGVYVVTPLRLGGGGTVLVLRGWLPAADGLHADLGAARGAAGEGDTVRVRGIVLRSRERRRPPPARVEMGGREVVALSALDPADAAGALGAAVGDVYVQAEAPAAGRSALPVPVPSPALDDGPHLSYAVQWFSFALITLVGSAALFRSAARGRGSRGRGG